MTLLPLGDSAISIVLGDRIDDTMAARVRALVSELERHPLRGLVDIVPAFASVTVFYDIAQIASLERLRADLAALTARAGTAVVSSAGRRFELPVVYGGEYGPDLEALAAQTGIPAAEVIALHTQPDYLVHAIGFTPGFPYLGGLPPQLRAPRRITPRPQVAAGSVAIGGAQTGVYPLASPGGWNIIGRTPVRLFDPARSEPALLRPGDRVKFRAMPEPEFAASMAEADRQGAGAAVQPQNPGELSSGLAVVRAGMYTTVQDLGRTGYRGSGVVMGGAADAFALRVANLLVGNAQNTAGLEFTLVGPELTFLHDTIIALTGAEFAGVPRWQPVPVRAGTRIDFGAARHGCRGYLAVAGGIAVPAVLGSRSTYVRAGFGGFAGRPLHDGDVLPVPPCLRRVAGRWHIDERILPAYSPQPVVRVVAGVQRSEFGGELFENEFSVTPQSDRMGLRLAGPKIPRSAAAELLSSAVAPGVVQIPTDGQPILLLADAQTIGGYPQVANVIGVDLPLVAQLRPGDTVRFREVTLAQAHELALSRERAIAMLREGLAEKLG